MFFFYSFFLLFCYEVRCFQKNCPTCLYLIVKYLRRDNSKFRESLPSSLSLSLSRLFHLSTVFRLSCSLPKRPHFGEVSVLDLLPGGTARFHCHMGYHLQGTPLLTCLNASMPKWNGKEPICRGNCNDALLARPVLGWSNGPFVSAALCGGTVKNATIGRVLSPSPQHGPNATQESTCSWSLEAPKDQRLHLHLERLALEPTDRWGRCVHVFGIT